MTYNQAMTTIGEVIDAIGVAVVVVGMVISAGTAATALRNRESGVYHGFRLQLGKTILLGLELLVVGDIIRTVAAQLTIIGVAILAVISLIRTFLSVSLAVELTGRWPWQGSSTLLPPDE